MNLAPSSQDWTFNPDPDRAPNSWLHRKFNRKEGKKDMQRRADRFRGHLRARKDKAFVIISHSLFLRAFLESNTTLENCGTANFHI